MREEFLHHWVPAQQKAAASGLAPPVISFAVDDEEQLLKLEMEWVDGVTLLANLPKNREEMMLKIQRVETLLLDVIHATDGCHGDWAARNIVVTPNDRFVAIDFENWYPIPNDNSKREEALNVTMAFFCSDWTMSFGPKGELADFLHQKEDEYANKTKMD